LVLKTEVKIVPISKLVVSEANVRKQGIEKERLKVSIEKEGVLEPIHVWYNSETDLYEIMQGQHRYYGALAAGIKELECVVHLTIQNVEDAKKWCRKQACLQEDLYPLDKLQIALDLKEKYGSLLKGCREEGLPYPKLSDWHSLRKLSPDVKNAVSTEISDSPKLHLPLRKLKEIARFPKEKQLEIARKIEHMDDIETKRYLKEIKSENASMPILVEVSSKAYKILREKAREERLRTEEYCSKVLEKECGVNDHSQ